MLTFYEGVGGSTLNQLWWMRVYWEWQAMYWQTWAVLLHSAAVRPTSIRKSQRTGELTLIEGGREL